MIKGSNVLSITTSKSAQLSCVYVLAAPPKFPGFPVLCTPRLEEKAVGILGSSASAILSHTRFAQLVNVKQGVIEEEACTSNVMLYTSPTLMVSQCAVMVPPPFVGGVVILAVPPAEKPETKVIPVGNISVRLTSKAGAEEVPGFRTVKVTKELFPGKTSSGVNDFEISN